MAASKASYVDLTDIAAARAAMRRTLGWWLIETPSNPLMKIVDLAAVALLAQEVNAISVCAMALSQTPCLQRPLDCGIDMVWHSTTKYIGRPQRHDRRGAYHAI